MEQCIILKLCSLLHLVNTGRGSQYLQELVKLTSDITARSRFHSASSQRYETPVTRQKISERYFLFAGPAACNLLPASLQDIRDHRTFLNETLKLNFLTVYTRHKTVLVCTKYI